MDVKQLDEYARYSPLLAAMVSFMLALIVAMTPFWQLTLVVAIIGGIFCTEMKWGAVSGTIGVFLAWLVYLLMNPVFELADQLGKIIIGSSGSGWIVLLIILIVGAVFGFLGGSIGSGIRMVVLPANNNER
ncbi:MAG: hypothetical protein ACFFD4_25095 [Candidatus Odinarchaeota archaeon]